ncbi:glycoside hydrolase family 31 protein [Cohnella thailandensis]|uniref:glycoside hydrolase family 31 protein n=1 Tax=Cohnella thailandensis TaxID=557557 RepID=UPI001DF80153|nr:alpha-glucosidase [Cohnella thailandensis]
MENSSAIHPDQYAGGGLAGARWRDIGNLVRFSEESSFYRLECEGGVVAIAFRTDRIVRVTMNPAGEPDLTRNAGLLESAEAGPGRILVEEKEREIWLSSSQLKVVIRKEPLRLSFFDPSGRELVSEGERGMMMNSKGEVLCVKKTGEDDRFYGFGEKSGFLDKRGERFGMWNTDVYAPHNPDTDELYVSIPFYLTLRGGAAHGLFFFNTFRSAFDLRGEREHSFQAEGGQLDYFVMAGPTPKDVLAQYASLTGRAPIPPRWALGYHQSRYSYETETEVRELAARFKEKGIPLDVVHLDIHYMYGYRVFTFDKDRFPDPRGLVEELRSQGIRVVPIVDPGVKADPEYRVFQEGVREGMFCGYLDGQLFYGQVWPEKSVFPDFTDGKVREWWGDLHSFYSELGIEGIWNDMNEPSVFNESKTMDLDVVHANDGRPASHRELHNVYGYHMSAATYGGMRRQLEGRRPFVLTRAGYAGIQKHAAVWTGDNRSFWEHLEMSVPMCLNLGLSGVPFCGADVGGFSNDSNPELLARWTQLGAFLPFFRNHSEMKSIRQEPWVFGERTEAVARKYIKLRYRWLPYLYSLFKEANDSGVPVVRPLFLEFPKDAETYAISDQFLLGPSVLVAPIVRPHARKRMVYLPAGGWANYWTEERVEGGRYVLVDAPLDTIPLFIREGAVIPLASERMNTSERVEELALHVYPPAAGESVEFVLYEDDGATFGYAAGACYSERVNVRRSGESRLEIVSRVEKEGYSPDWGGRRLVVHAGAAGAERLEVTINGVKAELLEARSGSGDVQVYSF